MPEFHDGHKRVKSINIIGDAERLICKSQEIYERMMKIFHLGFSENKLKSELLVMIILSWDY